MLSRSTTKVKIKTTNLANKTGYTSNISIPYDGQKNHDLEFFLDPSHNKPSRAGKDIVTSVFRRCKLDPSPLTRSLILAKTQPSVDLVFKSSLMNWECLCIFQHSMTKYCRRSQRYSKRHKTSFSPLLKRKQSFSDHDDHKIQRWFLFFPFKSKTNKKGERSPISSQFMNPSRILPTKTVFISNLTNPSRTSLPLLSYKNPIQQRCCHFLRRKTKTNHQPISQRFHQNTGPSLLIISREWQR